MKKITLEKTLLAIGVVSTIASTAVMCNSIYTIKNQSTEAKSVNYIDNNCDALEFGKERKALLSERSTQKGYETIQKHKKYAGISAITLLPSTLALAAGLDMRTRRRQSYLF